MLQRVRFDRVVAHELPSVKASLSFGDQPVPQQLGDVALEVVITDR
jgi:hypothetical protein